MRYLKRFNENIENTESIYDFNDSNYDAISKSITAAYMIIEDSEKTITVLNIKEFEDKLSVFADGHMPYTIEIYKTKLSKSQIEIGNELVDKPGFNWIKIPYWLVINNPGLKIQRIKRRKRFSNSEKMHSKLDPKTIDSDVLKYLSITDKDKTTLININLLM